LKIFRKSVEKLQVLLKSEKNNEYFAWIQYTFLIISRSVLLRTKNVSHRSCKENQNTHCTLNNFFSKIAPFMRQGRKIF